MRFASEMANRELESIYNPDECAARYFFTSHVSQFAYFSYSRFFEYRHMDILISFWGHYVYLFCFCVIKIILVTNLIWGRVFVRVIMTDLLSELTSQDKNGCLFFYRDEFWDWWAFHRLSLVPKHIKKLLQFIYCLLFWPNQILGVNENKEKPFPKSWEREKWLKNALPKWNDA